MGVLLVVGLLAPSPVRAAPTGSITGGVKSKKDRRGIKGAAVVLQCSCLQSSRQTTTTDGGLFAFRDLPAGRYTVQVLYQKVDTSQVVTLERGAKVRVPFELDPQDNIVTVTVRPKIIHMEPGTKTDVPMDHVKDTAAGGGQNDYLDAMQTVPTGDTQNGKPTLAGGGPTDTNVVVDGTSMNNPSTSMVTNSIVQEFIEGVEVLEAGYDAEYGNASAGQVRARRISGTNVLRGRTLVRFTPRLARPRFIIATDEALRVTQVPDYRIQAVVQASGPIIKDRLFWSVGLAPTGTSNSLVQSFHSRVDKDGSGGFEGCPYENGANDCVEGGNYIATEQFDEQRFKTGSFNLGWQGVLTWAINPRHQIRISSGGGPGFNRTTYRLPFSGDPNAFGTNPSADPLGGASRIATGVVNDHFGTDFGNSVAVSAAYAGRVANNSIEIDAGLSYFRATSERAWRVDNPELKDRPATQEQDAQGANLFEFLDRDEATNLVSGVDDACNAKDLPGLSCPTRRWLSGGIGEFGRDTSQRGEGWLNLTHFFQAAGSHQLKYGGRVEQLARRTVSQFSGSNAADFYTNCAAGQTGGGEWCYDPGQDDYVVALNRGRVDNHRFIIVDTDNPDLRATRGYGRARKEQGDLRTIADPLGNGARVSKYDESLSTQNYAVFLQDRWTPADGLYLSAGVRWEIQDMRDILGNRALLIWDNVAPRLGLVYDWTKEGKSRLFASYGWFYQPLPLQLNSRVFGGLSTIGRSYRNSDCQGQSVVFGGTARNKSDAGQPTEFCEDFAQFTTGLTTGAVVPRLKGQYNQQFQLGYEQEIVEDLVLGVQWLHTNLGRAVEDVSTNGGLNFIIANPGEAVARADISAKEAECDELESRIAQIEAMNPADPLKDAVARELQQCRFLADAYEQINEKFERPSRNFDAWTFRVQKRFARNWLLLANYTYSRLVGNYDGFVDTTTGAVNIGASTQYDLPELVRNSYGPLAFNAPHRVRLNGFYTFNMERAGALTVGTSFNAKSGYPISLRADNNRYAGQNLVYLIPRGSGGRIQPNYQWNLSASYAYALTRNLELEVSSRIFNVTNAKAVLRVDETYSFQNARPIAGGDLSDLKHAKITGQGNPTEFFQPGIVAPQGNFGVETQFQTPLSAQFEIQLRF